MIKVGTCSWTEKTLIESREFYPPGVRTAEERLKFYAENFDTVEVDSVFYAIPYERTVRLWSERTPEGFVFHIKAYAPLTGHATGVNSMPKDLRGLLCEEDRGKERVYIKEPSSIKALAERLIDTLSPLRSAGKLGLLVYQFPPWFQMSSRNLDYILFCKEISGGNAIAAEFRHGSWLSEERRSEVFAFLRRNSITYVTADEPQLGTPATVPFVPEATTETVYMRFHGRNRENWLKKGVATSLRYSYLYSGEELAGFVPVIKGFHEKKKKVYVMFNNCHGGFAVRNALEMTGLVGG